MPRALLVFFSASIGAQIKDLVVRISMRIRHVGCCACRGWAKPKAKESNTNPLHAVLMGCECCGQSFELRLLGFATLQARRSNTSRKRTTFLETARLGA